MAVLVSGEEVKEKEQMMACDTVCSLAGARGISF